MPAITSRQNPIVSRFRAAARGNSPDRFLLDGAHLVEEALAAGLEIREAAVAAGHDDAAALADRLRSHDVPVTVVSTRVMETLSPVRSASAIVALARHRTAFPEEVYRGTPLVVIAVDVQDPGNVGAIVRVAEAGGATGAVFAGACADPFGWKALRGSMGSALRLPLLRRRGAALAIDEARRHGCRVLAAVPRSGLPLFDTDLRGATAVLMGGEGPGLPDAVAESADVRVVVPMAPPVESLNVAVATGIIVYEACRQKRGTREPTG